MQLCNTLRKNSNLQQLGTHLSLVDLTASSVSITPSQAAGSDAPDGAVTAPNVAVMKVQAGNALLGQELKTAGGGFRHGVSGGGVGSKRKHCAIASPFGYTSQQISSAIIFLFASTTIN